MADDRMRSYDEMMAAGRAAPSSPVADDGLPEGWETRTKFRPGGYCETSEAMDNMQAEIKEWRAWAARRTPKTEKDDT